MKRKIELSGVIWSGNRDVPSPWIPGEDLLQEEKHFD